MKYSTEIQAAVTQPDQLENLYQQSRQANEEAEFRADLQEAYDKTPDNLLLSAWHARFMHLPLAKTKRVINWGLAVAVGVVTGLILFVASNPNWLFLNQVPYLVLLWAPITTIPTLIFMAVVSKRNYLYTTIAVITLILASAYVLLLAPTQSNASSTSYLILMVIQLPLLCWIAIGVAVMRFRSASTRRFAFLTKSIEVMITAGIYLIFGLIFGGITFFLFGALNITPSNELMRFIATCGFGLIPIMAIVTMYDPLVPPEGQDFALGLSRFVFTLVRLLLPLTLIVLFIYLFFIPFNFMAPFKNRDLLIIYNIMQFAIIGLLIGATPLKVDDLSEKLQLWLRRAIVAVAILAVLISLYALSAVIYRTVTNHLTLNRTTIIGWNIINILILILLIFTQLRKGLASWNEHLQVVFSKATGAYLVWSLLLIVLLPLIFK